MAIFTASPRRPPTSATCRSSTACCGQGAWSAKSMTTMIMMIMAALFIGYWSAKTNIRAEGIWRCESRFGVMSRDSLRSVKTEGTHIGGRAMQNRFHAAPCVPANRTGFLWDRRDVRRQMIVRDGDRRRATLANSPTAFSFWGVSAVTSPTSARGGEGRGVDDEAARASMTRTASSAYLCLGFKVWSVLVPL